MGLNSSTGRPELFIWKSIPVPPCGLRPSIGMENTSTEDDLTVLMSEIVECNTKMRLFVQEGASTSSLMEHWEYLQLQTAMYITSDLPGIPPHLQANLTKIKKGLCQRMKGKNGRFRGNLSGKRVDFSGFLNIL
jgi:DNA-directed RNA polymerase III subunit RPC1